MKIYLASSWKNEQLVRVVQQILEQNGHEVDAFCDLSKDRFVFHYSAIPNYQELDAIQFMHTPQVKKVFEEDKKWIDWADAVVMILPCGKSAHLEAGYAKGQGKKLYIFGRFIAGEFDAMYRFADGMFRLNETKELLNVLNEKVDNFEDIESNPWDEFWTPIINGAYQILRNRGLITDEEFKKIKNDNRTDTG